MCGIAGYCGPGPQRKHLLARMTDAIAHRGPDAEGVWADEGIGLGHRRLAIVGLDDGAQPMLSADGRLAISFNGEIFNYVELRAELKSLGHVFRTGSDTEVILAAYAQWGTDCLTRFNGDFAFGLWDRRLQCLFLARDRMGVRPLYYTRAGDTLWFASEIKALFTVPGISAHFDPLAFADIFTHWSPLPPRTAFENIFELPAGQMMLVLADGTMTTSTWWDLDFPDAGESGDARGEDAVAEEVLALLTDATAIRLRADVPVGSYLSGGLDSAIIATLATRSVGQRLRTFSVGFESAEHDETGFQNQMVSFLGTTHSAIRVSGADIAAIFPRVVASAERPLLRTAPAPMQLLSGLVRDQGMKVVLTGEGADEVFAGYDIFREAKVRRFCARDPKSTRRALLFKRLYPYMPALQTQSAQYLAASFGVDAEALDDPLYALRPRMRSTGAAKIFFSPELRARIGEYDAAEALAARLPSRFAHWHPLHQAQYLETRVLLPGYILSAQGDRVAMANGVEGRFPFLDHRVVEHAATIPPALKLRGLTEKHILRHAVRDLLPAGIGSRTKQPYRAPDSAAFVGPDAPAYLADAFAQDAVARTGIFNPKAAGKLLEKAGETGLSGSRDNAGFVGMLSTQLLARTFSVSTRPARVDAA